MISANTLQWVGLGAGWFLFAAKMAYDRVEWFFLAVNRAKYFALNTTTLWDLDIEYKGRFHEAVLERINEILQENFDRQEIIRETRSGLTVLADGMNLNVDLSGEAESVGGEVLHYRDIDIAVKDIRSTYRDAKRIVSNMVSILGCIDKEIRFDDCKYCATIKFKKYNPYFGLYVKRLKLKEVDSFNCIFTVEQSRTESNKVLVAKDHISVTAKGLPSFQSLSQKYLCLS